MELIGVLDCPECTAGKHEHCTQWSLDAVDRFADCPCERRLHSPASDTPVQIGHHECT